MKKIERHLEQTILKPDISHIDIEKLLLEAKKHLFIGVCIPPFWVKKVKRDLNGLDVQVVTVVGFPFGYNTTEAKVFETRQAIEDGADEIDVVWSLTAFKAAMSWPKIELAKLSQVCHEQDRILKVIIETAYLEEEEIRLACGICSAAGADYVKTSTGFTPEGAMLEHIRFMRKILPSNVGVKASGGIKTLAQATAMIEAGADRIGTSSGADIVEEFYHAR